MDPDSFSRFDITSLCLPASLKSFTGSEGAFPSSLQLLTFEMGCKITRIERQLFRYPAHAQIYFPPSLEFIHGVKFCQRRDSQKPTPPRALYTFDPDNRHFAMVGPTLMNFAGTSVIRHFGRWQSAITLDPAVEELGPRSFMDHRMSTFTFAEPSRVRLIRTWAFAGCGDLTSLTIPSSVWIIEAGAFEGCTGLQEVRIAPGSQLRLVGTRAFHMCIYLDPVDVPSRAKIRGLHEVLAKVRDVDGSKRKRVKFLTPVMRG
jgi:hypothetical protein